MPGGPLVDKWTDHRDHLKLVAPNNRRKFEVLVVGSGLAGPEVLGHDGMTLAAPPIPDFVAAVGAMRGSTATQQAAHVERLSQTALPVLALVARIDGAVVGAGQVALEGELAGIYDLVTVESAQRQGIATGIVQELLLWAWNRGASQAYLQVDADNAAALAVYRKFGFATAYTYHYRARPGECR
jgi:GNAT superfamily N-acetyltransferase